MVTPLARRLAAEAGIDLGARRGSGPHGRIVARDVETVAARAPRRAASGRGAAAQLRARSRSRRSTATCRSRRCRSTACAAPSRRGWLQAKQTIPHFYLTADVDDRRARQAARGGQRRRAEGPRRRARLQALGQRSRHQGLGGGAAAGAGRQRGVGGGSHPALPACRHRRRGRARRRADHAGDPAGREQDAVGDLERDEGTGRARAREEAQAGRVSGRRLGHLQSRHVRRARILRHHQSAACDHPGGRRGAPAGGRDRRTAASASPA